MELRFRKTRPDEVEQEVTQRHEFHTDEVGVVATLVRESHQNSLDAKPALTSGPVKTRICFVKPRENWRPFFNKLFAGLSQHLDASGIDTVGIDFGMPSLLLIEDFGTTGLLGQYREHSDEPFADFWKRFGTSHKTGSQAGRWGLGKLVFSSVSKIGTFFGLTIRHNDDSREQLLMGQAVLSNHKLNGSRYAPHGFFSMHRDDGFQLPVSDPSYISDFREACGITRTTEPGLSIIVPFYIDDLTPRAMIPEVLKNYFFPILTGKLEVDVDGELINAATFDALARKYAAIETFAGGHLIDFIRTVHAAQSNPPDAELKDTWSSNLEASVDPEILTSLRKKYMVEGKLIHVKAPIRLKRKDGCLAPSHISLFLQRAPEGVRSELLYVRGAITVPDEARYFKARQVFGILVATDLSIVSFLGDAENPAHTRWNGTAEKLAKNWQAGSARLREIRNSLGQLHQALAQAVEFREADALKDFFFVKDAGITPGRKPPTPRDPVPPIARTPKNFTIEPNQGGFTAKSGSGLTPEKLPLHIKVTAAYDVFRGNPFVHFDPFDFNFNENELKIECQGAIWTPVSANELLIEVSDVNFRVKVSGFDQNRDVMVRAR
ncbi:MAG: hypothetical protein JW384_01757 [Nitrosomonadaceae bacterium]|nr:hypothetical protein [Nitrosomonadaceae bacterium]